MEERLDWRRYRGADLTYHESPHQEAIALRRHEARLQEKRQERMLETQRLTKLKIGLQIKIAASKSKTAQTQAA